jgi:hypothetical protein
MIGEDGIGHGSKAIVFGNDRIRQRIARTDVAASIGVNGQIVVFAKDGDADRQRGIAQVKVGTTVCSTRILSPGNSYPLG